MATYTQAIRLALHYAETHMDLAHVFGQDVGPPLGGVFTATQGLKTAWNTPLDERGIIGAAMGLAMAGKRCVAEIQFCDYAFNTIDLLKLAGNTYWTSNGRWPLSMTVMTPVGSGIRGSLYHSNSFDSIMTHLPGWKVVIPSNSKDVYGLLLACIADPDPCMVLLPKALIYGKRGDLIPGEPEDPKQLNDMINKPVDPALAANWQPTWPAGLTSYTVPIGKAAIVKAGRDITVVSYGRTLPLCEQVAQTVLTQGIDMEVIDLRSLWPYDWEAVSGSILKTNAVLFVNEDIEVTNFGEHLLRRTIDELFYDLLAKPRLLAGARVPGIGLADNLEQASVPQLQSIQQAVEEIMTEKQQFIR